MARVYVSPQRVITVIGKSRAAYNCYMGDVMGDPLHLAAWCRHGVKVAQSEVSPQWEVTGDDAKRILAYRDSLGRKWYNCTT